MRFSVRKRRCCPPIQVTTLTIVQCRALYAVLLHPEAAKSGKSPMFLSLVYKAMKGDVSNKRVAAFAKRLLQVAEEQQPAFTCGCLLMLSELLKVACRCYAVVGVCCRVLTSLPVNSWEAIG